MGCDLKRTYKEIARAQRKALKEDLKIILEFFGFKVKGIKYDR